MSCIKIPVADKQYKYYLNKLSGDLGTAFKKKKLKIQHSPYTRKVYSMPRATLTNAFLSAQAEAGRGEVVKETVPVQRIGF